jgi:hypothetical protein
MVVLDDEILFPYSGTSGIGINGRRGMYSGISIGLASLRRDGFASMEAREVPGTLTTRAVAYQGRHFFVNAAVGKGELKVEMLDAAGDVLASSRPMTADSTRQRLGWEPNADLAQHQGKPVRFRFHLREGQLYAFWISDDPSGASRGYVGAGGPSFRGVRDLAQTTSTTREASNLRNSN